MDWKVSLLATILVPLLGSFSLPLLGLRSERMRNLWAIFLGGATFLLALSLLPRCLSGEPLVLRYPIGPGMDAVLIVDGLSVFMAIASSFISTLIIIYSLGYLKNRPHQQEYFMVVVLFLGAMMGLVFSANLLLMYVFWEVTGICSWRLIGFFRDNETVIKADKAFLITFGGAVFMLLGFALVYSQTHTFNLLEMKGLTVSGWAVALITVGIFAKSATLPFHTWLPDAGVAPTTVTALLHAAVLVKIGVYAFARIFNATFVVPPSWQFYVMILALLSTVVSGCAALLENNIKRILAYSTISQIGYMFMGLASFTAAGVAGALLFILMHGIAKAGLFLSAGIVEHGTSTKDISRMGGLFRLMPLTAISFLVCTFSVVGIPPFGGFYSKGLVIQGLAKSGNSLIAAAAILAAVLTAAYLLRLFVLVFLGEPRDTFLHVHREGTPSMVWVVASLAFLSLLSGLLVHYPEELVHAAVNQMFGNTAVTHVIGALIGDLIMNSIVLLIPVFVPILTGILIFILPRRSGGWKETLPLLATGAALVSAVLLLRHAGDTPHWGLGYPSLEIHFDFSAPQAVRMTLLIATSLEALLALLLLALPKKFRASEYLFFFLYGSGIVNGIILSRGYLEMVLFGELLLVTIYGAVVLMGLVSSYCTRGVSNPMAVGHYDWSNSRIFILPRLEITSMLRAFARLVFVSIDRGIDAIYERLLARDFGMLIQWLKKAHNGLYPNYLSWAVGGFILLVWFLVFETP